MIVCHKGSLFISWCIESGLQVYPQARAALACVLHGDINNHDDTVHMDARAFHLNYVTVPKEL